MITPFDTHFILETFLITPEVLSNGYVVLSRIPILNTVDFILGEGLDILSTEFKVEKVTSSNWYLYPVAEIDQYVLSWISANSSSSSSSSNLDSEELKDLLENGSYSMFQIRYLSDN